MISCFKGKFRVTSPRGNRTLNGKPDYHKGIDLVGIDDTTVYSICDGVARTNYQANGAGNYVTVTMADGRRVFYMHLAKFLIKDKATVKAGQAIGIMGNTGNSFGAHTHLELRPKGTTGDSLDICEYTDIPNKCGVYTYNAPKKTLDSGNDIVWELMNGKHKVEVHEVQRAVKALDEAKGNPKFESLYWLIWKMVNE